MNWEGALQANIDGLQGISSICVARFAADSVIVPEDIAIGIKAGIFGEVLRRLQGDDCAESEIARDYVPGLGAGEDRITDKTIPDIISGTGAFLRETTVIAVLRYQDKAGIGAVIDGVRPGVADVKRKTVCHPLVHVDEQAVVNGIPTRTRFEENAVLGITEARNPVDVGHVRNNHLRRIS